MYNTNSGYIKHKTPKGTIKLVKVVKINFFKVSMTVCVILIGNLSNVNKIKHEQN